MGRKIFDWHPELNLFAEKIPGRIKILVQRDDEYRLPRLEEVGFIEADDVAEYVYEGQDMLPDMTGVTIRAPWPLTWIEYLVPEGDWQNFDSEIQEIAHQLYSSIPGGLHIGTYIFVYEVPEEERTNALVGDLALTLLSVMDSSIDPKVSVPFWKAMSEMDGRPRNLRRAAEHHECHVIQVMSIYMADRNRWYQSGYRIDYLDKYGISIPGSGADIVDPGDALAHKIAVSPLQMALGFLNCRNIETQVIPQGKHQVKKLSRHGSPRLTRRTLVIHPQGKRYESGPTGTGSKKRWHTCRGHFKTFTEEAPLMGKVVGTFWWRPQARGSKSVGQVDKDYQVEHE